MLEIHHSGREPSICISVCVLVLFVTKLYAWLIFTMIYTDRLLYCSERFYNQEC